MKSLISSAICMAMLFISGANGALAQEPASKRKTPTLSSDDLGQPGSPASTRPVERAPLTAEKTKLERYSPSGLALSIELPSEPTRLPPPVPAELGNSIEAADGYYSTTGRLMVMVARFTTSRARLGATELKLMAAGFLDAIGKRPGVSNSQNYVESSDSSTVLFRQTGVENGAVTTTNGYVHSDGRNVWLIVTGCEQLDEEMMSTSARILESVRFLRR
jgi:hypothetical protein